MYYIQPYSFDRNNINFRCAKQKIVINAKQSQKVCSKKLLQAIEQGKTLSEMAQMFNCCIETIRNRIKEYGYKEQYNEKIKSKNLLDIPKEVLLREIQAGKSLNELAEVFNCSTRIIKNRIEEYDYLDEFEKNRKLRSNIRIKISRTRLLQAIEQGKTLSEMAEVFNCSTRIIKNRIKEYDYLDEFEKNRKLRSNIRIKISRTRLLQEIEQRKTLSEMAQMFNCSTETIRNRIEEYDYWDEFEKNRKLRPNIRIKISRTRLLQEIEQGKTLSEMVEIFNCSTRTIKNRIKEYSCKGQYNDKIKSKNLLDIPKEVLLREIQAGKSLNELAEVFNCSITCIYNRIGEYGYREQFKKTRNKNLKLRVPVSRARLLQEIEQGKTLSEMAQMFNCSTGTIKNRIEEYGYREQFVAVSSESSKSNIKEKINIPKEELLREIETGKTLNELAQIFNCSNTVIIKGINRYGLSDLYRKNKVNKTFSNVVLISYDDLLDMVKNGKNITEMAAICKCSVPVIISRLKEYKIYSLYSEIQASNREKKADLRPPKEELLKQVRAGKSISELAILFNCSESLIYSRLVKYGINEEYRAMQDVKSDVSIARDELISEINKGMDIKELASIFDCYQTSIQKVIDQYNLREDYNTIQRKKRQRLKLDKKIEENLKIQNFVERGYGVKEIAMLLGINVATVRARIRALDCEEQYTKIQKSRVVNHIPGEELAKLVNDGCSIEEIASFFNTKFSVVRNALYANKLMSLYNRLQIDKEKSNANSKDD